MNQFIQNKVQFHPDRIHDWMVSGSSIPLSIELDLTNSCDNFCPWCFGYEGLDRQDKSTWNVDNFGQKLSTEEAFDVIDQIKEFGIYGITLTGGGEPLVHKDIMKIIPYINSRGLELGLITNGNRLSEEKIHIILENCLWMRVSVDATNKEEYLQEHGVKSWDQLVDNIKLLGKIKEKYTCSVGVGFLTNGDNDESLMEFARLGSEWNVDFAQFRPMLVGWGTTDCHYKSKDTTRIIKEAQEKYNRDNYSVLCSEHKYSMIDNNTIGRTYSLCHGESFTSVIGADMKMYVCCHMRGIEKYIIGDLRKNTIKEIWESYQRKNAISNIDVNSFDCPPLCRHDGTNRFLHELTVLPTHKNFI